MFPLETHQVRDSVDDDVGNHGPGHGLRQLERWEFDRQEDGSKAEHEGGVADKPVGPVEDPPEMILGYLWLSRWEALLDPVAIIGTDSWTKDRCSGSIKQADLSRTYLKESGLAMFKIWRHYFTSFFSQ